MSILGAFIPQGKTFFVDNTSGGASVTTASGTSSQQYRVVNRAAAGTMQYFAWAAAGATAPTSPSAPVVGTPGTNVIGMLGQTAAIFNLAPNAQFIASAATGFDITPGEGR